VHEVHAKGIKRTNIGLSVILPQIAAMPRPWDGGALEGLQSICACKQIYENACKQIYLGKN